MNPNAAPQSVIDADGATGEIFALPTDEASPGTLLRDLRIVLRCCVVAAVANVASASPVSAADLGFLSGAFEAKVEGVTDYVDRGVSETGGGPAVQGIFDYALENGLYAEISASSVDFTGARAELAYTLGWEGKIDDVKLDAGVAFTTYPGSAPSLGYDYWEASCTFSRGFGPIKILGELAFSPDYFGGSGKEFYAETGPDFQLPLDFTVSARVGQQWVEDPAKAGVPDYLNWQLGIGREVLGFTGSLRYTGTNAAGRCGLGRKCGQALLFELSRKLWPN
jgi:uncharacterized protein (TIGR02001 family)